MFSFKRSLIALVGLLALIVTIVALVPRVSSGQGNNGNAPPAFDVNVVNTPLPVRNVDNPARQPFSHRFRFISEIGSALGTMSGGDGIFTVPAGKHLVIEDASAQVLLPVGQRAQVVLEVQNPAPEGTFRTLRPLTLTFQLTSILGLPPRDTYVAGEPVRLDLEPGERLRAFFQRSGTSDSGACEVYVQGYLVDVP